MARWPPSRPRRHHGPDLFRRHSRSAFRKRTAEAGETAKTVGLTVPPLSPKLPTQGPGHGIISPDRIVVGEQTCGALIAGGRFFTVACFQRGFRDIPGLLHTMADEGATKAVFRQGSE
jgi:hypothetical protein